jgi:hypothetical protein
MLRKSVSVKEERAPSSKTLPVGEATHAELAIERFGFTNPTAEAKSLTQPLETQRAMIMRVCDQGELPVQCYIERDREGLHRLSPVYRYELTYEARITC